MNTITGFNRAQNIKWLIVAILTMICLVIPEGGFYNHSVKLFLAITVFSLALAAFELVHVVFIAFVMPGLWIFFGVAPAATVLSSFASPTVLMYGGALFLAATLEDCGLLKRIAYVIMSKVKGSYLGLLVTIMITGVILNILSSGQACIILGALAAGLCMTLDGMQKRLGAGLATAVILGTCTSHAYTYSAGNWAVIMQMGAEYMESNAITPLNIILHCWPLFLVSLVILFVISKWYKPEEDLGQIEYFEEQLKKMGKVTRREKANVIMLIILLVYIFTVNIHKLDLSMGFALIPWMVFLPFVNGADEDTVKKYNVPMIFFIISCMAIGTVASSLGLNNTIAEMCQTLLAGNNSPVAILGVVFGIVFILNFLMTPMAIFSLLIGPISMLAVNAGYSPVAFAYAVQACSEAIIMPYEYIPYLIVYSFGMISMKDFIKTNIVRSIMFFIGFLVILVPYWKLIGLL